MKNVNIGGVIQNRRVELGLTQEQLCEGICEPSTLSKIENGKQDPTRARLDALLQRMGMSGERYYALVSREDFELRELEQEIIASNTKRDFETTLRLIAELEQLPGAGDPIVRQFILRTRLIAERTDADTLEVDDCEAALALLNQAIRMTVPRFDLEEINKSLLCFDELHIIVNIALAYHQMKNRHKAIDIYRQLLKYVRNHYQSIEDIAEILPRLTFNYSNALIEERRYDEALEICEIGRKHCVEHKGANVFGALLWLQTECFYKLGKRKEGEKRLWEAYYVLQAMEQFTELKDFIYVMEHHCHVKIEGHRLRYLK